MKEAMELNRIVIRHLIYINALKKLDTKKQVTIFEICLFKIFWVIIDPFMQPELLYSILRLSWEIGESLLLKN